MKKLKGILAFALAMTLIPMSALSAQEQESVVVKTKEELVQAVTEQKSKIVLGNDIELTEKLEITHDVEIDGQNNKLYFDIDNSVWSSKYALHFYMVDAVVKNITITGGNAAILVNGSNVKLEGTIDVSGNYFGGIEVSKGQDVTTEPTLDITNATLVNTDEKTTVPTIWTDGGVDETSIIVDPLTTNVKVVNGQVYVFVKPVVVNDEASLKQAIADELNVIELNADITLTEKLNISHNVRIKGNGHTLTGAKQENAGLLYGLHFYMVDQAIVEDIVIANMDAAILVNGSNVALEGTVNVSGNVLGGIEVSQGNGVTKVPTLDITNATLVNTTESYKKPTVWTVGSAAVVVDGNGVLVSRNDVVLDQVHYYLEAVKSPEEIEQEAKEAEALEETTKTLQTIVKSLESKSVKVTIDENGKFEIVKLNSEVDFTQEELVNLLAEVISHEKVQAYKVGGVPYTDTSVENVKVVLNNYITSLVDNPTSRTVSDLITTVNANLDLGVTLLATNGLTVDHDVNLTFDKQSGPVVTPEEDKEETTTGKTPSTGILNTTGFFTTLLMTAFALLVALKLKKSYSNQ